MKQFTAILLLSLILSLNIGITINNHYCGGELSSSSFSIGSSAVGCGMEDDSALECDMPASKVNNLIIEGTQCCENGYEYLQIDDDYQLTQSSINHSNISFIIAFLSSEYYLNINQSSINNTQFITHSPPIPSRDIQLINQTFLI